MRVLSLGGQQESQGLIARVRRGEPAAIGELYDAHHVALRAFALRLVGDEATAEDLIHEVFVSLPRVMARFRGDSSVRSFLTGVAINHARHYIRSAQRRRAAVDRMAQQPEPERVPSPEAEVRQQDFLESLHRAMDSLSVHHRVAFVLCDVEERTAGEAASITGAPEATMRTRLHHARKKLRTALEMEGVR